MIVSLFLTFGFFMLIVGWAVGREFLSRRVMKALTRNDDPVFTLGELVAIKSAFNSP